MRNEFEHDVINAGKPRRGTIQQARQLPTVAAGQMPARHLYLFFDKVEIIQQPFSSRGDAAARMDGKGGAIEVPQNLLILLQPGEQAIGAAMGEGLMGRGQRFGMAGELLDAEQLSAQWLLGRLRKRIGLAGHPILQAPGHSLHVVMPVQSLSQPLLIKFRQLVPSHRVGTQNDAEPHHSCVTNHPEQMPVWESG